jgi:4-hydroxy-tetrahydrodipicolinate synthase
MAELRGIIAPAATPFDSRQDIDLAGVGAQTGWLIDAGVHGIAAGGSTGEGHTLDGAEFRNLVATTVEAAAGRVPVVAGIITDSTRDAVARGQAVSDLDVAALQVTPVHYLFRPDDEAMLAHFRTIAEEAGRPVIIYNVVPWTYLSPALLLRIMREVPGVIGVKQSAGDLKLLADLVADAGPADHIFSAVDALLYPSYALGARGAIAAILSAAPHASVALWDAVAAGDHGRALDLHGRLLRLWNAMAGDNLPACVKAAQSLQGCPAGRPRAPMPEASEAQRRAIQAALDGLAAPSQAAQ